MVLKFLPLLSVNYYANFPIAMGIIEKFVSNVSISFLYQIGTDIMEGFLFDSKLVST